ncbi:PilC/PilY family type IV pilus protein [Comamonas sp. JUb58]|uniref:PilC/PilY family type IV pilus protein n=1 Tax=Comamonas sp. JUb58 TaxID=2485114 RepID=UPI001062189B|nr:PilC/PilY family type IV pilus protein [Comamonas sp. JUb58]TDS76712.1 Tfp pilus tip-associated adhesin PilY1 [Comamonas sp. JUb58]
MKNIAFADREKHRNPARAWSPRLLWSLGVAALVAAAVGGGMAIADTTHNPVDISDVPVNTFAQQDKPNVMLLMDTSDSMKWTHMPDDWDPITYSATFFPVGYKSALCNSLYYNPATKYELPAQPDGTVFSQPSFTGAWIDGYDTSKGVVNLATSFQAYDISTRLRQESIYNDPAQAAYYFEWVPRVSGGVQPSFEGADVTAGACNKVSNSAIKVDNGSLAVNQASANINTGSTTAPDGYWIRRGITTDAQQKNFAIWYSFYRTRINMAKSSISLAFNSLDNNFRIGFLTAAKPDTTTFKFMPVKDFESTDKSNWFQTIQSAKTGGSSPTREALARVGRYYANKSDSINTAMNPFDDPVVSACQRHYAIVTTDGYWNVGQETKGPMQLDGTTLVGQQDGPDSDPAYNRPLTGPDGLTPRPIYDGSTSGSLLRRDASIGYAWNACGLGWQTLVPGGGTKTETTYKKTIKKSVKTQKVTYGTVLGFYKSTLWTEQKAVKTLGFTTAMRTYKTVFATKRVLKRVYKHTYTWNAITQSQYRNILTTSWATEKQEPFGKAVYKRVQQKRYFYSYINQAIGEIPFKTTDKSVCAPYGCNLVGSDQWQVVNASCTPGMDGDYKVECQVSEVPISASNCSNNGQFVAGQGTIYCEGKPGVAAINGPVPACGTLHPSLVASGVTAGMVLFSGCNSSYSETSYVTDAQCVNTSPVAPDFKRSNCAAKQTYGSSTTNNYCAAGVATGNVYTVCSAKKATTQFVDACPADLSNNATKMDQVCGNSELFSTTDVVASSCAASSSPLTTCEEPYTTTFGTTAVNPATCTGDRVCETRYSDWGYAASCTPQAPSSSNGWTGIECNSGGGTCTPATGSPSTMVNGAVKTCTAAGPSSANGCFLVTCENKTTDPVETTSCSTTPGPSAGNGWVTTKCVVNNLNNQPVQTCPQSGVTNCNPQTTTTDMAYGACVESGPTSENGWTTTTCEKVEQLSYLSSAADYAACTSGTAANGVETLCSQEGPTTITVPQGQACAAGYDPLTHKVTVCNVDSSTPVFSAEKPADCATTNCTQVLGQKKVFSGSATTHRVNLLGASESTPQLISSVDIPATDLESPAQCYSTTEAAGMTLPSNGRPLPANTVVWSALPAGHQSCTKLPCDTVEQSNVTGGSRNSLADVAQYYYGTDLRPELANLVKPAGTGGEDDKATWQHMATYVIGMGVSGTLKFDKDYKNGAGDFAGIRNGTKTWPVWPATGVTNYEQPQSIDDFWHTAVNGRGLYFSANDPQAIKSGLGQVFSDIRAAVGSGAGVAVSSALVEADNNFAYGAVYRSGRWSGELLAYEINLSSLVRTVIANWSAKTKLDTRDLATDDRRIYFMDGTSLKNFSWSALGSLQSHFNGTAAQALLSQYSGMSDTQKTAALGENLVKFLRGDRTKEGYAQGDDTKLYRSRESRLGDIIGSQPLHVGKPLRKYRDAGYAAFRLAQKNRRSMVYVGGNDGMLHAFYAEADVTKQETIGGKSVYPAAREAWAFVPKAMMPAMPALASTTYDGNHRYFVDGSPVTADIFHDGAWKTILVGGFNKGGNGYYALDITDPESPKALWEASASTMGQSYGKPLITKMPDGTWVALVTSGYNNADGKGYVYVLNAGTGAVVQTITNADGSGMKDLNNFMKDPSGNNTSTLFYGGDIQGNIWRYQWVSGSYQGQKVVQLKDKDGNAQPITTRLELVQSPNLSALPRILVATGKLMGLGDLSTAGQQTIYGIDDVADGYSNSGASFLAGLKQSVLTNVTAADGKLTRKLKCATGTEAAVCNDATKSWYVNLPDTGERVNVDLRLANTTLVVASNVPSNEPCVAGGKGWINYLDFQTGQAVNTETGMAGEAIDGLVAGIDLVANQNGDVSGAVSPSLVPENPIDVKIPVATPKPLGKRISWRELVNK